MIIDFIKEKRKILISAFLVIGLLSSLVDVLILAQRPQQIRSKASELSKEDELSPQFIVKLISPKKLYKISFDSRLWSQDTIGLRTIFKLNHEYGFARLDIIEGESEKDLESLKNETVQNYPLTPSKIEPVSFNGKPSYLITYTEKVIDEDVYFDQQIIKENNAYLIIEKRVPKLGLNQEYLDNLLQSISFDSPQVLNEVKGIQGYSTNLTTVELADLIRPSVANILYVYCLEVKNLEPQKSGLSSLKYNFCASAKGSGFIVNEKGVVATNGHVVRIYPEEGLVTNLLYEGNREFSVDLLRGIYLSKGQNPTKSQLDEFYDGINFNPQYIDKFLAEIFKLIGNKLISVSINNEKYYVNLGTEPVKLDYQKLHQGDYAGAVQPSKTTYFAKLLDFNYPNKYSYDAIVNKNYRRGVDVALLQLDSGINNLFPALELGSINNLREGSEIVVVGYPTLVEGEEDPRATISYKTSTKPTVTRGIVSSIKEDLKGKKVIQTDASIDHGTSGGPAFSESSEVVGIATFAVESKTGNFNFLRDIDELKELMLKNNVKNQLENVTKAWRDGLNSFRNKHYNQAIKYFNEVESINPSHPTVKEFIQLAQEGISNGESLEGLGGFIKGEGSNVLLVIFSGLAVTSFVSSGFLTILPVFSKEKRREVI